MDFKTFLERFTTRSITVVAVAFCLFHLYTAATGPLTAFEQRVVHLTFGLMLVFLTTPLKEGMGGLWHLGDWVLCLAALIAGGYLYLSADGYRVPSGHTQSVGHRGGYGGGGVTLGGHPPGPWLAPTHHRLGRHPLCLSWQPVAWLGGPTEGLAPSAS